MRNSCIIEANTKNLRNRMSTTLPTYHRLNAPPPLLRISFGKASVVMVALPLGAFAFCVVWSLLFDFYRSTFTHCEVRNFLPSISSAIGSFEPQKTVWRLAIILDFPLRLWVAKKYYDLNQELIRRNRRLYVTLAYILNVIENCALLSLTLWTSSDDYTIHRNSFGAFIVCSELYMLISYFLNKNGRKKDLLDPMEEKSLKYKRNLFAINVLSFSLAGYFFVRHNAYCEPGVYSIFALFEYIVVWTNMAYHMTAYWDFYGCSVIFELGRGFSLSRI